MLKCIFIYVKAMLFYAPCRNDFLCIVLCALSMLFYLYLLDKIMISRTNYSSGSKWEDLIGYSRAVRVGDVVEVTGTVACDADGKVVGVNDAYLQTKFIYEKMEKVLKQAGAEMKHVVRVRMFVTDIKRWEEFGKGHAEFFSVIKPCLTMIEVSRFIEPELLVEIEASAIIC